jgi:very-short-patch-repair endonuclease
MQYHTARNRVLGRDLASLAPTDAKLQCYFNCLCGRHCVYILLKTIHQQKEKALRCRVCEGEAKSRLESHIWGVLDSYDNSQLFWVPEARILKGKFAAADAYLPEHKLAIQIDGSQHFGKEFTYPEDGEEAPKSQRLKDFEFNEECARKGYHLLRIHEEDVIKGEVLISMAITECRKAKLKSQTLRSLSRRYVNEPKSAHCVVQRL